MHRSAFLSVRSASWTESWMLSEGTVRGFWEWRSDYREETLAVVRTWSNEWRMVDSTFGGTVSEAPGKKVEGLLPHLHFVSWMVLGCDFMPPATIICI